MKGIQRNLRKPRLWGLSVLLALVLVWPVLSGGPSARAAELVKIGAVAPKTGPLAAGAAITHWPNIKLWVTQVNARGGLKLKSGRAKIKLIEYDDRTNPGETIKAVQRLATQDKVDFILAPYGSGLNLAAAPIFAKYGYPQITSTSITDKNDALTKRYPGIFFTLGSTTSFAGAVAEILKKMKDEGKIGNRIAMVNVADAFGIELANAARPIFKRAGFQIVYDKSYPLGTQDLSPVIKGAKAANPDAFVAWSYPPDTFGLTAQAKINGLNVKAFYTAVATAFPAYLGKFGKSIEGVLGAGGVNPDTPEMKAYFKAHKGSERQTRRLLGVRHGLCNLPDPREGHRRRRIDGSQGGDGLYQEPHLRYGRGPDQVRQSEQREVLDGRPVAERGVLRRELHRPPGGQAGQAQVGLVILRRHARRGHDGRAGR